MQDFAGGAQDFAGATQDFKFSARDVGGQTDFSQNRLEKKPFYR
jgi:hypothetical protein